MNILLIVLASFYVIHFLITLIVLIIEMKRERKSSKIKENIIVLILLVPLTLIISIIYVKVWNDKVEQKNYWKKEYLELKKEMESKDNGQWKWNL